jgi:hypothetical protein
MKKYELETYKFLKNDFDFIMTFCKAANIHYSTFMACTPAKTKYNDLLKECLCFCFTDINPFLNKPYLDISYLVINNKYVNLDEIHFCFKDIVNEYFGII